MLYGMKMVSGIAGSIMMSAHPRSQPLASFLLLKEKLGWRKALAVLTKLDFIVLALAGMSSLALAIFADFGVTVSVILNSLRLLRFEVNKGWVDYFRFTSSVVRRLEVSCD